MKVFITGGNGYIGSHIIKKLLEHKHEVFALIRPNASLAQLESVKDQVTFFTYEGNYSSIKNAMASAQPDIVVHIASCFLSDHKSEQIDDLLEANIKLGLYLLEAMKELGIKNLINTGTYSQYFQSETYEPAYLYDATKQAFEDLVYFYHGAYDIKVAHLFLYDNYGPNDPRKKLLSFLKQACIAKDPIAMSQGEQCLDLIFIDDAVAAYIQTIETLPTKPTPTLEYYAVRTGTQYSLREIAKIYEEVMGTKLNVQWGGLPYRKRQIMKPSTKFPLIPNWQAKTTLREGLMKVKLQG